jgi:serine/threonine protein phosphatase PrpC
MQHGGKCADIAVIALLMRLIEGRSSVPDERLRLGIEAANKAIYQQYRGDGGTTITALLVSHSGIVGASVGDSRIYSYSKPSRLKQISVDDTIAGELGRQKKTDPANLDLEPFSHRLAQFVGVGDDMETGLYKLNDIGPNGIFILSSDGAHSTGPAILQAMLETATTPYIALTRLIQLSRWCGGRDNATVVSLGANIRERLVTQENTPYSRLELWDSSGKLEIVLGKNALHSLAPFSPPITQSESALPTGPDAKDQPRRRGAARVKSKKAGTGAKAPPVRPAQRTLEIELVKGSVGDMLPPAIDLSGRDASAPGQENPQADSAAKALPSATSAKRDSPAGVLEVETSKGDPINNSKAGEGADQNESLDRQIEKNAGRSD